MIIIGANWAEILTWNCRVAGALWAAWGGGFYTARQAQFFLAALSPSIQAEPGDEVCWEPIEVPPPKRHLQIVE